MGKILATRLLRLVATLFAVTLLSFLMTSLLPGDPAAAVLGQEGIQNEELLEEVREPNWASTIRYRSATSTGSGGAVQGDLGESYINRGQSVSDTIKDRLPVTAQLAFMAIVIAVLLAIPIGIIGAYRQGQWQDQTTSAGVQVALSVPNFITGIFLIWLFAVQLKWLPASNWNRISDKGLLENLKTAILPATALALTQMAIFSRLVRSDMIATLQENYVLSAESQGSVRSLHPVPPRPAAQFAEPGHDRRHQLRCLAGRHRRHRDAVRHSRSRLPVDQRHQPARHPGHPGHHGIRGRGVRDHQHRGRSVLHGARSSNPEELTG